MKKRTKRAPFAIFAWSYAALLVAAAIVAGVLAYRSFERNIERHMGKRIEGNAQLIARRFEPDTLARLLEIENDDDPLVTLVHNWVVDAAASVQVRRLMILTPDGRVAVDSADIGNRGSIDYSMRVNLNEITEVVETGSPRTSILYEVQSGDTTELFKTSYALVPRVEGTRTNEHFVAACEIPLDYPNRLERIRLTTILLVGGLSLGTILFTGVATLLFARLQRRVEVQTRKAELAEFSAAIAHEIKNPLAALMTGLQLLERKLDSDQRSLSLKLTREVRMLDRIVKDFLAFARGAQRAAEHTNVGAILAAVREQLTPEQERILSAHGDVTVKMLIDKVALTQAIANLVKNAAQAATQAGTNPSVRLDISQQRGRLVFDVVDNGPGVPEEVRARLFEPFVSGRVDGTGLGLAIVRRLVEDMGGEVELVASAKGRTHFRVVVPRHRGSASRSDGGEP